MTKKMENSLGDLKDKVVNASEIKIPESKPMTVSEYIEIGKKSMDKYNGATAKPYILDEAGQWKPTVPLSLQLVDLTEYCFANSLMPEDLVAFHREHTLKSAKRLKTGKATPSVESKHLNWRENYKNKKIGNDNT